MYDRLRELRSLFDELVDLDEADRAARLREIGTRDQALRDRLEEMLVADAESATSAGSYAQAAVRSVFAGSGPRAEGDPLGLLDSTVGRYRIDGLLGAGGMGVVYRATDQRLGRVAALKFLPPVWNLDQRAKERFLLEARAASSLDHPNVCTIYEADERADGTLYMAMACYEGETLRDRLARGPLGIEEALDLAQQAAMGLAAAHARGLVHRDIKPANLLVTSDGTLKILDFGIAKAGDVGLTMPGQRPGTAAYMAPEQERGHEVDGRTDLWSLGVVLYEMLTGTRPAVTAAGERPPPPSALRAGVPAPIDALVLRMLNADPTKRPADADDVATALAGDASGVRKQPGRPSATGVHGSRSIAYAGVGVLVALIGVGAYVYLGDGSPGGPGPEDLANARHSIVVLPFANQNPDRDEYFADGVTDDVLAHISLVPELSVISRTTTMSYKGAGKSVSEIASELGVQYVLEGSVRRAGQRIRINAQLVDGGTDRSLWSQNYDREYGDIFAVQSEIAGAIAEALEIQLSGGLSARIERRPTEDVEAYDLFLIGRENYYRYDVEGHERAIEHFREALDRDPDFALARAWLARTYALQVINFGMERSWADSAVAQARQAIAAQPDLSDAHNSLGSALSAVARFEESTGSYEQALALNPNDWIATHNLGTGYEGRNRWDEAIRYARRSLELDPIRSQYAYSNAAFYYAVLGLHGRAEASLERALALAPDDPDMVYAQAFLAMQRGQRDAALRGADRLASLGPENPMATLYAAQLFLWMGEIERARDAAEIGHAASPMALRAYFTGIAYGYALVRTGEQARGRAVLAEMERYVREQIRAGGDAPHYHHALAVIHSLRSERDEAFRSLDEAILAGWNMTAVVPSDPLLDGLHGDPRFDSALDRMRHALAEMRERVDREGL